MKIAPVGLGLARNVFQIHGVDERGKLVLRKQLKRERVACTLRDGEQFPF